MRILVHDYCGHPFQAQLSRQLAARGHEVVHLYSASVVSPQGALRRKADDPVELTFEGISLGNVVDRKAHVRRFLQERTYGALLAAKVLACRPDIVISANAPLEAQIRAFRASATIAAPFVFWLQDVHGVAIGRLLSARLGFLGKLIGIHYRHLEQRLLKKSDAVVAISEDFCSILGDWGVSEDGIWVIPNWASTDELPERPRRNAWARANGLIGKFSYLYSGTLGMKHNPELLLRLALQYRDDPHVSVTVVSEGPGAQWLSAKARELGLPQLKVLPFQPYSSLPDVMGSADVLVAILEPDAGVFSVPSKVLSYLCAGRPLLLAIPPENLAARIVAECGAGTVVPPGDVESFLRQADYLLSEEEVRKEMGVSALKYARENFDLDRITDRFEEVFEATLSRKAGMDGTARTNRRGHGAPQGVTVARLTHPSSGC